MEENPILRIPYEEPTTYHELDAGGRTTNNILQGRRPSEATAGIPSEDHIIVDPDTVEPHKTINRLREVMKQWREGGLQGTTTKTRRLLEFWHNLDPGVGMRPFWCQMEAIETIIWLFEAGQVHDPAFHKKVMRWLAKTNNLHNDGIPRTAFKMATGSGKTNVMAMAMLWILVNETDWDDAGTTNFLVIAPNLTVRDRLMALNPKQGTELWDDITPREFRRTLNRAQVTVVNFHVFQRRAVTVDGKSLGSKEKRMLGKSNSENYRESEADMIGRVLLDHVDGSKVIVINDEAHHCYKPHGMPVQQEDREYQEAAALWFNALRLLKEQGRLARVYDFSATPMWLSRPSWLESEIFPWTVSDFPLLDAVESGLVKIPRVPVEDDTESYQPKYRNIYEYNSGKPLTKNLAVRVQEPLKQLYRHYHDVVDPAYANVGVIPVFIIVVNNIKNAVALYRWIAGGYDRKDGRGTHGNLELFSNYDRNGNPQKHPPTLLVHSRLFDKTPIGAERDMVGEQATLFGLVGSLDKQQEQVRSLFTSVGRGRSKHIRCVISIGMLTEGWDAKNVTHIFGYRRFGSLLLCEQVTGRALRRTSIVGVGVPKPEYANIFGVPYTFARGGDVEPQPPAQAYRVFSVPGRERFRISFPNVVGYENPKRQRRFRLNPRKVKPYVVNPAEPTITVVGGPVGSGISTMRERRIQTAVWETANSVSTLLNRDFGESAGQHVITGRRISFADSCNIVREWLSHPDVTCKDPAGVMADPHVPQQIAEACEYDDETLKIRPIFADENQTGERFHTTEGVRFRTTLQHKYRDVQTDGNTTLDGSDVEDDPDTFLRKSELNRAACHSREEAVVARILDNHPKIEAWARNFRLDFKIRWFDKTQNSWRDMDPDFVARVKTEDGGLLHLVIEFKGMRSGEAEEQAKRFYIGKWWCPAVSGYNGGEYGQWRLVWIEDTASAERLIGGACP